MSNKDFQKGLVEGWVKGWRNGIDWYQHQFTQTKQVVDLDFLAKNSSLFNSDWNTRSNSDSFERHMLEKIGVLFPIDTVGSEQKTPDGLSYEEIYGSVIYQQNKKREK